MSPVRVVVTGVRGIAWVQDGGRRGFMHHGVPPGGALCPERLAQANRAVKNAWDAPALEVWGHLRLRLEGAPPRLLWDGGQPVTAVPGAELPCGASPMHGVRYVAVEGGFEVPDVLGGRGTLAVAKLGGHEGRPLRRGDVLEGGDAAAQPSVHLPELDTGGPIRFIPASDAAAPAALEALAARRFRISASSDRVGTRLGGAPLPTQPDRRPSSPMVRGAIQLPPGGEPIVLGPDHPTTGGYPLLGVVIRADLGRLGALAPGAEVTLAPVTRLQAEHLWRAHRGAWFDSME